MGTRILRQSPGGTTSHHRLVASVLSSAPRTSVVSTNGYASEGRRPVWVGRSCSRNWAARQFSGKPAKGVATRKVDWRRDRHHVLGTSALASGAGESRSAATDSAQLAEIASGHIWACCTVDSVERQTQARLTLGAEERVAIAATTVEESGVAAVDRARAADRRPGASQGTQVTATRDEPDWGSQSRYLEVRSESGGPGRCKPGLKGTIRFRWSQRQ